MLSWAWWIVSSKLAAVLTLQNFHQAPGNLHVMDGWHKSQAGIVSQHSALSLAWRPYMKYPLHMHTWVLWGLANKLSLADSSPLTCLLLWIFSSELPENISFSLVSRNKTFYTCFSRLKYQIDWLVLLINNETGSRYWILRKITGSADLDPQVLLGALQSQVWWDDGSYVFLPHCLTHTHTQDGLEYKHT